RLRDDDHVVCVNVHHLVTDAWSCGVIFEELRKLYDRATGARIELRPVQWQFADFARFQGDELAGSADGTHYWERRLAGLELPALPLAERTASANGRRTTRITATID